MKKLTLQLVLPLTVLSFATVTKWWYALPVDAPDTLLAGFPFPFVAEGWHTSMSLQFFILELCADFLTYFIFWFGVLYAINRFWRSIHPNKMVTVVVWIMAILIIGGAGFIASNPNHLFYVKRPFDMEVLETGYKFVWQPTERPDYSQYHREDGDE